MQDAVRAIAVHFPPPGHRAPLWDTGDRGTILVINLGVSGADLDEIDEIRVRSSYGVRSDLLYLPCSKIEKQ